MADEQQVTATIEEIAAEELSQEEQSLINDFIDKFYSAMVENFEALPENVREQINLKTSFMETWFVEGLQAVSRLFGPPTGEEFVAVSNHIIETKFIVKSNGN